MKKWRQFTAVFVLTVFTSFSLFAAEPTIQIEPYRDDEFPDWLRDVRRAEIVTLGSLPFSTLSVSLVYMLYRYADNDFNKDYFPNPLAKSSAAANLSSSEQIGIITVSLGISAVIGLTDYIVSTVQHNRERKEKEVSVNENIVVEIEQ